MARFSKGPLASLAILARTRETILGWTWPLVLLLVQLAALVFIFGHVVDLSIPNYPYRAIPDATSSAPSNVA